jgi:hypothetical protein
MTVYVDDMYLTEMGRFGRMKMSHMFAHTDEELHQMADSIGMSRRWFQGDHYDVSIVMREKAIARGARKVTLRLASAMMMHRRITGLLLPPALAHVQVYGHYTISRNR